MSALTPINTKKSDDVNTKFIKTENEPSKEDVAPELKPTNPAQPEAK